MNWENIVGHTDVVHQLKFMLDKGRVPHALLFEGPHGIGKGVMANVFAKGLLCEGSNKPCGHCRSCRLIAAGAQPDLFTIKPEGSTIKIDQMRKLKGEATLTSLDQARVCIIHNSETMTIPAANSLLKLLEDPPENLFFILVSSAAYLLLPTIVSRCTVIKLKQILAVELEDYFVKQGISLLDAKTAVRLGGGRIGTARGLLQPEAKQHRLETLNLLSHVSGDMTWIWDQAAMLESKGLEEITESLSYMSFILRDIVASRLKGQLLNYDLSEPISQLVPRWSERATLAAYQLVIDTNRDLEAKANIRLTLEALLIRLADILED